MILISKVQKRKHKIKSVSLYLEDRSRKIVFLDFGSLDTAGMSTGLKKEHPTLEGESTPAEIVDSIIHEEGFVHGIWYCSGLQYLNYALNNTKLREYGFPTFTEFYLKVCEN